MNLSLCHWHFLKSCYGFSMSEHSCNNIHEKNCSILRAMQFKCNTSANYTFVILECDWLKDNGKFSRPMISLKMKIKIWCRKFVRKRWKNVFLNAKKWLQERSSNLCCTWFFSCLYYTYQKVIIRVFSFNSELISTFMCELYKELKLQSQKWLLEFQLFEKLTSAN